MRRGSALLALLLAALASAPARAQTTISYPLTPIADTDVRGASTGNNCGTCTELEVRNHALGESRPAYRFSLSSIPTGSRILSATLRLWPTVNYTDPIGVRRITVDWAEGTATWFNTSGLSPGSTTYATFSPTAAGRYYDMDVKTLVDRWWKSEVPNYGMVLTTTRDPTGRLTSKEWSNSAQRPQLVIVALPPPLLVATRSSTVVSDPVAGTTNPKRIPGAVVQHTLAAENQSSGYLDPDVAVLREAVPSGTALYVGDLGTTGSGPIAFTQGSPSSGLTFTYSGLASTTDDVAFSNDGGATYGYIPTPNASGYDSLVTHVSLSPKGTWAGDTGTGFPKFTFTMRSMVQ